MKDYMNRNPVEINSTDMKINWTGKSIKRVGNSSVWIASKHVGSFPDAVSIVHKSANAESSDLVFEPTLLDLIHFQTPTVSEQKQPTRELKGHFVQCHYGQC